jgi:hypothetical protein
MVNRIMFKSVSVLIVYLGLVFFDGIAHAQSLPPKSIEDNFTWTPWLSAGERVWGAVMRIEPKLKDVIGDGHQVAVAVTDLNFDRQNDIILYFWGPDQCGADGCSYVILSNNGSIKRAYTARVIKRQGFGLNVDGRYYKL